MGIEVSGLRERIAALDTAAKEMFGEVRRELISSGAQMARDAKGDHRFTSRSGNLERSITADVSRDALKMTFGFVSDATQSNWKKAPHVSYGTFQHEGTRDGYQRSRAADKHGHTPGSPGIKADHFIVRAWDRHIGGMMERIREKVLRIVKGAVERGVF